MRVIIEVDYRSVVCSVSFFFSGIALIVNFISDFFLIKMNSFDV